MQCVKASGRVLVEANIKQQLRTISSAPSHALRSPTKVRDYKKGTKVAQGPKAGAQKASTRAVREDDPSEKRYILIYSLGDEMYKWANPSSVFHPFAKHLEKQYKFPTGHYVDKSSKMHSCVCVCVCCFFSCFFFFFWFILVCWFVCFSVDLLVLLCLLVFCLAGC